MCRCQKRVWPRAEGFGFWGVGLVRVGICAVVDGPGVCEHVSLGLSRDRDRDRAYVCTISSCSFCIRYLFALHRVDGHAY